MASNDHPPRDTDSWERPDLCPFCGVELTDEGIGFVDHLDEEPLCKERFDAWKEHIRDDIGGEWSG